MKRLLWITTISGLFLAPLAEAITIGPATTKRERERSHSSRTAPRAGAYEAVLKSFLNEDFVQSERLASRFAGRNLPAEISDEILHLRALSLLKLSRFAEARPILQQLSNEAVSHELRAQAAYSLGDSYYFENKRAEADIYYKEAVQKYPTYGEAETIRKLLGPMALPARQFAVEEASPYSVQVGAFSRRRNAERLLNRLLRNRYDAYILPENKHFRVRIGHFPSVGDAQAIETQLKKDGYPTKICP